MSKKYPLLRRLESALSTATSDSDRDLIYLNFYHIGEKVLTNKPSEFYGRIVTNKCLNIKSENLNYDEVQRGRDLAKILRNSISLPKPTENLYRLKINNVIEIEYPILTEFFKK